MQAKFSQVASIPEDRLLFRGVGGMLLPECFYEPDETGVRGGVDPAFLSATTDRSVAVHYIAGREAATIFSISVSAVCRGACLSHISQFPEEEEVRAALAAEEMCPVETPFCYKLFSILDTTARQQQRQHPAVYPDSMECAHMRVGREPIEVPVIIFRHDDSLSLFTLL